MRPRLWTFWTDWTYQSVPKRYRETYGMQIAVTTETALA